MTTRLDQSTTVREIVGRHPQTRPVFESHGIDYCCGGGLSLAEAAQRSGSGLDPLVAELEEVLNAPPHADQAEERDWYQAPLGELVRHIVDTHHVYLRTALPRVRNLLAKVVRAHGAHHGEMLRQVKDHFGRLDKELSLHMIKEEQVLFPHIAEMEASLHGSQRKPIACFGSVDKPIRQMEHEHDSAGVELAGLRRATADYRLPEGACPTFAALYEELQRMEADLHEHIHLENNILFPRATELERQPAQSA